MRVLRLKELTACGLVVLASCGGTAGTGADQYDAQLAELRAQSISRIPEASELQQEILSDLYVTPAEADRAAADVVECMSQQGYETKASWDTVDNTMQFTTKNKDGSDQAQAMLSECWNDRFLLVGEMLASQYALSFEQTKALEQKMIACLAESGIQVDRWPSDIAQDDLPVESECYDRSIAGL